MFKFVGRMYDIAPKEYERYHLRFLLLHVMCAANFEDFTTYKKITYSTFKESTMQRKLIQDDTKGYHCLQKTSSFRMPQQLRQFLFFFTSIFQQPSNVRH